MKQGFWNKIVVNYYVLNKSEGVARINAYGEAPVLESLITYKLPLSSIFRIKKHSHLLFKKLSGIHHNKIVKKALGYTLLGDLKKLVNYFVNKILKRDLKEKINLKKEISLVYEALSPFISLDHINLKPNDIAYAKTIFKLIENDLFINEKECDEALRVLGTLVYLTESYRSIK